MTIMDYRISSNKCPQHLLNFEMWGAEVIKGRRLFQSLENEQY